MQVHLQKKNRKKSWRRLFFHDSRYFSVFFKYRVGVGCSNNRDVGVDVD